MTAFHRHSTVPAFLQAAGAGQGIMSPPCRLPLAAHPCRTVTYKGLIVGCGGDPAGLGFALARIGRTTQDKTPRVAECCSDDRRNDAPISPGRLILVVRPSHLVSRHPTALRKASRIRPAESRRLKSFLS